MPKPKRKRLLASIDTRFFRKEIRKVLRKCHNPSLPFVGDNLSATECLGMFQAAIDLLNPELQMSLEKRRELARGGVLPRPDRWFDGATCYLAERPVIFCKLVLALVKSEERIKEYPKNTPERVIEECAPALWDTVSYPKLMAALPRGFPTAKEPEIRNRVSRINRVLADWKESFAREGRFGGLSSILSEDGKSVELYELL
jgi:hypothetical protein